MKSSKKTEFTEDDMTDMAFESELFYQASTASQQIDAKIAELAFKSLDKNTKFEALKEQLTPVKNKALNIGHLTKFLTLFNDNSAAARILSKEFQSQHLVALCQ